MNHTPVREVVCQDTQGVQHTVRIVQQLRFVGDDVKGSGMWIQSQQYVIDGLYTVEQNRAEPNVIRVSGTEIVINMPETPENSGCRS